LSEFSFTKFTLNAYGYLYNGTKFARVLKHATLTFDEQSIDNAMTLADHHHHHQQQQQQPPALQSCALSMSTGRGYG